LIYKGILVCHVPPRTSRLKAAPDETTDKTTQFWLRGKAQAIIDSHSIKPVSWQVAGYRKDDLISVSLMDYTGYDIFQGYYPVLLAGFAYRIFDLQSGAFNA
jgi:hypothetical protein